MLEYETANPGQDAAKPLAEDYDPNAPGLNNRVSFMQNNDETSQMEEGHAGPAKEYGEASRPHSDSPAPPNPNDQFVGLEESNTHELSSTNTAYSRGSSDHAPAANAPPPLQMSMHHHQITRKPAMKPVSQGSMAPSKERSIRHNTNHNRNASGSMSGMGGKGFYDDAKE